jgi:hypothetical protein
MGADRADAYGGASAVIRFERGMRGLSQRGNYGNRSLAGAPDADRASTGAATTLRSANRSPEGERVYRRLPSDRLDGPRSVIRFVGVT